MSDNNDLPVSNPAPACVHFYVNGACIYCKVSNPAQPRGDRERDWEEDFPHENGNYKGRCFECGELFIGHKRRVQCKLCASRLPSNPAQGEGGELDGMTFHDCGDEMCNFCGKCKGCEGCECPAVAEPAKGVQLCKNCGKSYGFHTYPNEFCPGPDLEGYGPERYEPIEAKQPSPEQGEQEGTFEAWWYEQIRMAQIFLGSGDYWVSKGIAKEAWQAAQSATDDAGYAMSAELEFYRQEKVPRLEYELATAKKALETYIATKEPEFAREMAMNLAMKAAQAATVDSRDVDCFNEGVEAAAVFMDGSNCDHASFGIRALKSIAPKTKDGGANEHNS